MEITRVHLIRHGQVEGFEEKRYNGQGEVALTSVGLRQYEALQARLAAVPLAAIYTSDLSRCAIGARLIGEAHGLEPVPLSALRELHVGEWEGLPWVEIERRAPELWQARLRDIVNVPPPGGESVRQLAQRLRPALREIVARHRGQELLIVGHGGVNRVILLDALGAPLAHMLRLEQGFGCYNRIDYGADGATVVGCLNG